MNVRFTEPEAFWLKFTVGRLNEFVPSFENNRLQYKFKGAPLLVSLTREQRSQIRDIASYRLGSADCVLESEISIIGSILQKL